MGGAEGEGDLFGMGKAGPGEGDASMGLGLGLGGAASGAGPLQGGLADGAYVQAAVRSTLLIRVLLAMALAHACYHGHLRPFGAWVPLPPLVLLVVLQVRAWVGEGACMGLSRGVHHA